MPADRDAPPDQTATCAAPKKAANYIALGEALPAAAFRCTSASIAYGDRQRLGYETSNCAQLRDRHANSNIVEILGADVASSEDGAGRLAGWLALPRGLSGVALVISDDQLAPRPAWGRNSQLVADLTQQAVPARHVGIALHADWR